MIWFLSARMINTLDYSTQFVFVMELFIKLYYSIHSAVIRIELNELDELNYEPF